MATIKLLGLNAGVQKLSGDTDTLETDGSLTVGNDDADTIIVNAEFDSSLIPDDDNTVDLGSGDKSWREICVGTRINLHGTNFDTRLEWEDPTQHETVTIPAMSGHVALEGNLPSFLTFGKANDKSAPLTNFELCTVNGSQNAQGWRMPVEGIVTHMSCQFRATANGSTNGVLISLWKNGVNQGINYEIALNNLASSDDLGASQTFTTPLPFAANDKLTLKMDLSVSNGSFSVEDMACLLRVLN